MARLNADKSEVAGGDGGSAARPDRADLVRVATGVTPSGCRALPDELLNLWAVRVFSVF
jgi:hypothetical protein